MKARGYRGFGWDRWSRSWLYKELGLFRDYYVQYMPTRKCCQPMSLINFYTKPLGQRSAGKPHAALDEAGAGNVTMVAGLRANVKAVDSPPEPKVRAPVLDPT